MYSTCVVVFPVVFDNEAKQFSLSTQAVNGLALISSLQQVCNKQLSNLCVNHINKVLK